MHIISETHFIIPMLELTTIKAQKSKNKLKERKKADERRKFKILFTYFFTMLKNSYVMMITLIMRSRDVNDDYTVFCTPKRLSLSRVPKTLQIKTQNSRKYF